MVIQRGGGETWDLPSDTGTPLQHQLVVTSLQGVSDSSELHTQYPFHHQGVSQCQISNSTALTANNNEKMVADTVPQLVNSFTEPPVKEIKLEPQEYVDWNNTFNLRQANLAALPGNISNSISASNSTWRGKFGPERGVSGPMSAVRSLDLLRQNLQAAINQEIDLVISRYLEKFFQPAVENIKDNFGQDSVTEDMLRKVCRQVLEEAKMMYTPSPLSHAISDTHGLWKTAHQKSERCRSHKLNVSKVNKIEPSILHPAGVSEDPLLKVGVANQNIQSSKRKCQSHKYSSSEHESNKKKQKCGVASSGKVSAISSAKTSGMPLTRMIHTCSSSQGSSKQQSQLKSPSIVSPSITSNHTAVICNPVNKLKGKDASSNGSSPKWNSAKWEASRIMSQTLFVMGARANKALGFGQMRGRLYIKHPELFKYSGDQEDKEWLTRNHLMPPTGGKAYLMIVEDIKELAETDEYKNNPNLLLDEIHGFEAPDFMLKKIRCYVNSLRIEHSNSSHNPGSSGRSNSSKTKSQQKLPKPLPPPPVAVGTTVDDKSSLENKLQEPKLKEVVFPIKSILETKLLEEKSSLPSTKLASTPCTSSVSPTSSSVSSSTTDNKITLKSLLESKTTFQVGEK